MQIQTEFVRALTSCKIVRTETVGATSVVQLCYNSGDISAQLSDLSALVDNCRAVGMILLSMPAPIINPVVVSMGVGTGFR